MPRLPTRSLVPIALGAALVAFGGYHVVTGLEAPPGPPAPDVRIGLLDGHVVELTALRGQVVLVNFWATWCPPCRVEMPGFQRVYEARRGDGFTILGLSADVLPDEELRAFARQRGVGYPLARVTGVVARAFGGATTLPSSFLIDTRGRIREQRVGVWEEGELAAAVDALLAEAGRAPAEPYGAAGREAPGLVDLAGAGSVLGKASAPVTVVEFSDYGCPYCGAFSRESFPELYAEFVRTGQVRWVQVPFVLGRFANSEEAAAGVACAAEQGEVARWAVHFTLFRRQPEWTGAIDPRSALRGYVEEAGGDVAAFDRCMGSERPGAKLARAESAAVAAGVGVTPTFFINGARVEGAPPLPQFRRALREAVR